MKVHLSSTKASYTVGTATIVDVLQQQSNLYNAQTQYAVDQYSYIISTLTLKEAAGTLSVNDMLEVNSWLGKTIDFSKFNFNAQPIQYAADTLPKLHAPSTNYNHGFSGAEPQQTPPAAIKSQTTDTVLPANTDNNGVSTTPTTVPEFPGLIPIQFAVTNKKVGTKKKVSHTKLRSCASPSQ